jgi:hypothetical protein
MNENEVLGPIAIDRLGLRAEMASPKGDSELVE